MSNREAVPMQSDFRKKCKSECEEHYMGFKHQHQVEQRKRAQRRKSVRKNRGR